VLLAYNAGHPWQFIGQLSENSFLANGEYLLFRSHRTRSYSSKSSPCPQYYLQPALVEQHEEARVFGPTEAITWPPSFHRRIVIQRRISPSRRLCGKREEADHLPFTAYLPPAAEWLEVGLIN